MYGSTANLEPPHSKTNPAVPSQVSLIPVDPVPGEGEAAGRVGSGDRDGAGAEPARTAAARSVNGRDLNNGN